MAITFGSSGAASQKTINYDSLFTSSLANYRRTLADNISTSNPFWAKLVASNMYEGVNGGTNIELPLMTTLGTADWYEGYDTLNTNPLEGHTMAVYEWREASTPISISRKEERQNGGDKIFGLLEAKIKQAEMGFQETMAKAYLQGSLSVGGASLETPVVSAATGASGINPIAHLIQKDPTTNETVGNINQSTNSWWRNQTASSTAATLDAFLKEVQNMYNNCSKGPGGPPDIMLMDQGTYEMFEIALWNRSGSRAPNNTDLSFPFENLRWRRATAMWDEFMGDVQNNSLTVTKGTIYFINSNFITLKYDTASNFVNTPFASSPNQPNARVSHILWMGQLCTNNRRKHGVLYNIDNTLTS